MFYTEKCVEEEKPWRTVNWSKILTAFVIICGNSISMALRVGKSIGEKVPAPMMMNVGV